MKKINLLPGFFMAFLCIGILLSGVFSATASNSISGTVSIPGNSNITESPSAEATEAPIDDAVQISMYIDWRA